MKESKQETSNDGDGVYKPPLRRRRSKLTNDNGALDGVLNSSSAQQEISTPDWTSIPTTSPTFPFKDIFKRTNGIDDSISLTGTASISKDSTSKSGSWGSGTNIWNRLLRTSEESVWDSINVIDNDYDDGINEDGTSNEIFDNSKSKTLCLSVCCPSAWYELRTLFSTMYKHPQIILTSLAVTGLVCGLGMWAIISERDAYIAEQKTTATFIATEIGAYFANEFRRAFLPLFSLREAILHSVYFYGLADKIGRYPNLLKEDDVEVPGGFANVRNIEGICDDEDVLKKWEDLVDASTAENDLEGMIVRYRLLPKNVFCLDYKHGHAMMDSGLDISNSKHPFWSIVAEDLFIDHWKGIHAFGPYMMGKTEAFCTHLAIYDKNTKRNRDWISKDGATLPQGHLNVQGTEVSNVWGMVNSVLDWSEMKKRSRIYERFKNVDMDFYLTRREEDIDHFASTGPKGEKQFVHLASSENSDLLDDSNSIVVETDTLHGIWENRIGITSANGWNPGWLWPAVASVIVVSILLGFLAASTLAKSQLHRNLVESMIPKKACKKLHRNQTVVEKYNIVTVFYADVVDFSGVAGHMSSVQVMDMLNDLFTEFDRIAKRHGVYKVETTANGRYMVVAGAPEQESARSAAKRVALFALNAMTHVDSVFRTKAGDKLFIRAGLASGPAVAGCIGKAAPSYCFFGAAVDAASNMEKTSKKMKIQCSEMTYRLLQDSEIKFVLSKRETEKLDQATYWIEQASPCIDCFGLFRGSYILHPCGHVLCGDCNVKHNLNVCPTCRCKVEDRIEWKGKCAKKVLDFQESDLENGESIHGSCIFEDPAESHSLDGSCNFEDP